MPRRTPETEDPSSARIVGALLRGLRRDAGFASVAEAAARPECPAALQTIYGYERGVTTPTLRQFTDLVEFYALGSSEGSEDGERLRYRAVAAMTQVLALPAFHVADALDLIRRLQPDPSPGRRRRGTRTEGSATT